MTHKKLKMYSPTFRVYDEVGERRVIMSVGDDPKEIHIGEARDIVIHWLRQPTSGSITLQFQSGEQKAISDDLGSPVFDSVDNGTITFSATPNNKKIIRDVWSSHMLVTQNAISGTTEFIVETITFVSRS